MSSSKNYHIIILSRKCQHSVNVVNTLTKNGCMSMVKLIFLEDNTVRIPYWVKRVPVMITNTGNRISDDDLFWFINECLPRQVLSPSNRPLINTPGEMAPEQVPRNRRGDDTRYTPNNKTRQADFSADNGPASDAVGPQPFSTTGMDVGFSDAFSFIGANTDDRIMIRCSDIENYQHIQTPPDEESPERTKLSDENSLERLIMQRDKDINHIFKK